MPFAIVPDSLQPTVYEKRVELADLTATSAAQDLGKPFSKFRLTVFVKTASTAFTFRLDVADDSGFTSNVRSVARLPMANVVGAAVATGIAPVGGQRYARVTVEAGSGTYDARIEAGD